MVRKVYRTSSSILASTTAYKNSISPEQSPSGMTWTTKAAEATTINYFKRRLHYSTVAVRRRDTPYWEFVDCVPNPDLAFDTLNLVGMANECDGQTERYLAISHTNSVRRAKNRYRSSLKSVAVVDDWTLQPNVYL